MNLNLRLVNYITRYAPSRKKIIAYLFKKKCQNIEEKLEEIGYNETLMIEMWMKSFIALGKGEREISQKLIKKEFPRTMIEEMMTRFHGEVHDWTEHKRSLEHQIITLLGRGKSKRMISALLIGKYPYFREEISLLLEEQDDKHALEKELEKVFRKYSPENSAEIQKIYASLMRKGFRYEEIKRKIVDRDSG